MGAVLGHYQAGALAQALGREFMAGHLLDAAHLSSRGSHALDRLTDNPAPDDGPDVRR